MKARNWLIGWLIIVLAVLIAIGLCVIKIDPYFHYHEPNLSRFYYSLDNQRSQNDGICKHFDYDALITGTSMTENFKTSDMDWIFGVNSIKVPFSGGTYKEMNDNLIVALENNPELKTIVRCLDYSKIFDDKDLMRKDLGTYPTYLYDKNPLNDVQYLFNKDVIFSRTYVMLLNSISDEATQGITSFDDYSRWQLSYTFGVNTVLSEGASVTDSTEQVHLSNEEKETIYGNITQNVTSLADQYPDVDFYYFFSPYSAAWWINLKNEGTIYRQIEAEQYIIELILPHSNIHLYSFNNRTDITTDLNNYKDDTHYGQWINSLMLRWMKDGQYMLTENNYQEYIEEEREFYTSFDYTSLNNQVDYENDFYAAALLNKEFKGVEPINVLDNYALQQDDTGTTIKIDDIGEHDYLVFYGKRANGDGQHVVRVYDSQNGIAAENSIDCSVLDDEWHQYVIDLSGTDGSLNIAFEGGSINNEKNSKSDYVIENVILY